MPAVSTAKKPKRPRYFGHLPSGSPKPKAFTILKEELKQTEYSCLSQEDKITKLVVAYGLNTIVSMKGVLASVPKLFPNRSELCINICKTMSELKNVNDTDLLETLNQVDDLPISIRPVDDILWGASIAMSRPLLIFLVPNIEECIVDGCSGQLYGKREEVTEVTVFTLCGPKPGLKVTLVCSKCRARFGIDKYRPCGGEAHIYPPNLCSEIVQASNKVFFSQDTFEFMCESGNHGFVSAQAFSQTYQTVFNAEHPSTKKFLEFLSETGSWSGYKVNYSDHDEEDAFKLRLNPYMSRKNATEAFFNGELKNEVQQRNMESSLTMKSDNSREDVMKKIDEMRKTELYPHPEEECSEICKKRGCRNLRVIDSCWKLCIQHCMLSVQTEVQGAPLLNFPNVCTAEPKPGSVFCIDHHTILLRNGIPTEKKDFLRFIGCKENPSSQEDIQKVDQQVIKFMDKLRLEDKNVSKIETSASNYQGTSSLIEQIPTDILNNKVGNTIKCTKDTGEKGRLRQRARGHFAAVSGGGHILTFNPIYKSESPSQVFMLTVQMIYNEMKDVPDDQLQHRLEEYILSYDNMCSLDRLKASTIQLPLPGHLAQLWSKIRKIIDRLHLSNHKDNMCQTKYNPEKILTNDEQSYNTMAAEQLFSWMSRFKKIVNSMSQTHHLFYLHRMCQRRNRYTALCRKRGAEPVHPGININLLTH